MNIPECIVAQQLDEILRKVALTIDQQRRAIEQLPKKREALLPIGSPPLIALRRIGHNSAERFAAMQPEPLP
jgi:hypothetical protein